MALGVFLIATVVNAQQARDVVTEERLRQEIASTASLKSQFNAKAKALKGPAPIIRSSLWSSSIILIDGEKFTLVPIGSVLHLPAELRSRVVSEPEGDFTFWPAFLKRNAEWLSAKEVTLTLSRGNSQEAKALIKSLSKDSRIVIATFKGGPITILEPANSSPANSPRP